MDSAVLPLRQAARGFTFSMDLAEHIGSPDWWRGLGVMTGLGALALSLAPTPYHAHRMRALTLDATSREIYRSQTIAPLALGGDMGMRMGPTRLVQPAAAAPERPRLDLVATLAEGDTLERMLARAGVGAGDSARARAAIASALPLSDIAEGTRFDLTLGQHQANQPRPLEKLAFRARFDLDLALVRSGDGFALTRHALPVDATPLRIRGVAGGSIYRAARAAGAPMKAIQQFLQAIDAHLSLDEVHQGDTFDMIVAYKRAAGGQSEVGQLLYAGIESGGKPRTQLLRWGPDGQFFDAADMDANRASQSLIMPVAGARITSSFGLRFHPILGRARMHAGTDLAAAWGSPVYAVASGVVTYAAPHGGHGNYIRMEHGGGVGTGYGHLSRYAVQSGMRVRAGQVIGYVGSSGLSTGPHLHYELYRNGQTVDPMSIRFVVRRQAVDAGQLAAYKARLRQVLALKPGLSRAR
ncbi:M23 family metallopeptidase [Novosphingobium sp. UBA1939]|uniref:M23 family metallopeptidase n=1 Tax=Novosphingobium sp. UBA1939 TaxID=1946982 RepID=UPI0025E8B98A|nr:M23 family metallopeptidase [Novosphingobium sp. UBA1939]